MQQLHHPRTDDEVQAAYAFLCVYTAGVRPAAAGTIAAAAAVTAWGVSHRCCICKRCVTANISLFRPRGNCAVLQRRPKRLPV
jgi:hypothetical protein